MVRGIGVVGKTVTEDCPEQISDEIPAEYSITYENGQSTIKYTINQFYWNNLTFYTHADIVVLR